MNRKKFSVSLRRLAVVTALGGLTLATAPVWACSASDPYLGSVCYMAASYCPEGYLPAKGQVLQVSQYQALYAVLGNQYGGTAPTTFALPDLQGRTVVGTGPTPPSGVTPQVNLVPGNKRGTEAVLLSAAQVPLQPHTHTATLTNPTVTPGTLSATGSVSLPVAVNVPGQNVSVSGQVKIANATAGGQQAVTANAVLGKGGAPANIYATSATTADTNIGPTQTFTGTLPAQTVNSKAEGTVTLPVTGSIALSGGVTVNPAGAAATQALSLLSPQLALTACVATNGIFPVRPN